MAPGFSLNPPWLLLRPADSRYNVRMHVAIFAMRVLEGMFFVGLAGSAVVVVISFIEDAQELFGKE